MAKIDLHKLALAVGFEVICVEDDSINYEYMLRIGDIESISYVLKLKNDVEYSEVDELIETIIMVLPNKLKRKVKKLMKKRDKDNIDNIIDLLCYTITEFKSKTKYVLLREYGRLVGVKIEDYGFYFKYKLTRKEYIKIKSLVESKLPIEDALIVGKMKNIEYKIGYVKQKLNSDKNQSI